jgi:hypothetical protein
MKTFTVHCEYPAHYRAEITVEAEDVVSACRSAIDASHTADGWKSLDTEHPTYVSAIAEGADVILGASSPMEAMPLSCPSRACSLTSRPARAMPRPGARIW